MIVSPKIPNCGHLTQPQGRAGTAVARRAWMGKSKRGLNTHSQTTVTQTYTELVKQQTGTQSGCKLTQGLIIEQGGLKIIRLWTHRNIKS